MIERIEKTLPSGARVVEYIDTTNQEKPVTIAQRYVCTSSHPDPKVEAPYEMEGGEDVVYVGSANGVSPPRPVSLARLGLMVCRAIEKGKAREAQRAAEKAEAARKAAEARAALDEGGKLGDVKPL